VRSSGSDVRITCTPEDTEVIISRGGTEESVVWSGSRRGSGRKAIEQVGGGVKALGPEARGQRGLEQESAHNIVRGADHALSLAVLGGGVRTGHAQLNTTRQEERAGGVVVELTPVVTLDGLNGEAELSGHPGKEVEEGGKSLRLRTKRESPRVMGEIINHYKIVLESRDARNRGGPQITMDKSKGMRGMRRRRGKRKSNMTTELARMTEVLCRCPGTRDGSMTTELSENVAARMTKTAVPGSGRRRRGKSGKRRRGRRGSSGRRKTKSVKGPRAITAEKRSLGSQILDSETGGVELDRARVGSSELTNGKKVVDHLRSNKNIRDMERTRCRADGGDRETRPITNHDRRRT
jgi:hypothetical protein